MSTARLFLIYGFPRGPHFSGLPLLPRAHRQRGWALAGEEEVCPPSPHICTDPSSSAGCPDSLRLKKGTLGKTQFIESVKGTEFCFWCCWIQENQASRSRFLHGSSYIFFSTSGCRHCFSPRPGVPRTWLANRALCFWYPPLGRRRVACSTDVYGEVLSCNLYLFP